MMPTSTSVTNIKLIFLLSLMVWLLLKCKIHIYRLDRDKVKNQHNDILANRLNNTSIELINKMHYKSSKNTVLGSNNSLCVIMRTYEKQSHLLSVHLLAWEAIANTSLRPIRIFLVNTDRLKKDSRFIIEAVNKIYNSPRMLFAYLVTHFQEELTFDDYGYGVTQLIIDQLLNTDKNYECTTYLITNGDNYYHPEVLVHTGLNGPDDLPSPQLIAVDFISHHMRSIRGGIARRKLHNQVIYSKFKRKYVDLGAVFLHHSVFHQCPRVYFQVYKSSKDNFALDWFFFNELLKCHISTNIVREVLFVHQ